MTRNRTSRRTTSAAIRRPTLVALVIIAVATTLHGGVQAAVSCDTDEDCQSYLGHGSRCYIGHNQLPPGTCTNAFADGCLRQKLGPDIFPNKRACNSDDVDEETGLLDTTYCQPSRLNYTEIRINTQNWESPYFIAWVMQIVLSEVLDVPTTTEYGPDVTGSSSFYDTKNRMSFSTSSYQYELVREADRVGDCRLTDKPCAHVVPEVWNGQDLSVAEAVSEGYMESSEGNGEVGKISWFIPAKTAKNNPRLLNFFGLQGEDNRKLLAETFLRPTTWGEYCYKVRSDNCTFYSGGIRDPLVTASEEDGPSAATRAPMDATEEGKYYSAGAYTGYFRATDENNCTKNPTTCTGHIGAPVCDWATFIPGQTYHHDIALNSTGPSVPNNGYSYGQLLDLWYAANATGSDIMMWWWRPSEIIEVFRDTPFQFEPVTLTQPTVECTDARPSVPERCSADINERRGSELAACGHQSHSLQKLVADSLYDFTYEVPEAGRSPGYDTVKNLLVTDLEMEEMLQMWINHEGGTDHWGHDGRDAVCTWVSENIDSLMRFIPTGYPRVIQEDNPYESGVVYAAQAVAYLAIFLVASSGVATYHWRDQKVMESAPIYFLASMLLGTLMLAIGAILSVLEPSMASCTSLQWMITLGYTVFLVTILVKAIAINAVVQKGVKRANSVEVPRRRLGITVASIAFLVIVYLSAWTAMDPPTRVAEPVLTEENGNVVQFSVTCTSSVDAWQIVAHGFELLLIVTNVIIVFQGRNLYMEYDEAQSLATLTFSNLLFTLLLVITDFLSSALTPSSSAAVNSFLLSLGVIAALLIYFGPKFKTAYDSRNLQSNSADLSWELKLFLDNSSSPIFGLDRNGNVTEWNSKMAFVTGYTLEEVVNKNFNMTFVVPKQQQSFQEVLNAALTASGTSNYKLEFTSKSKDVLYLLVNTSARRDSSNDITGVIGVAQDVTEATKNNRAAAAVMNEHRQLIETANAPIFGIDVDGNVNEWNAKVTEITGFTKEGALGKSLVGTFAERGFRKSFQVVLDNALKGRETKCFSVQFRTKRQGTRYLVTNATPRRDEEGNVSGVVCVAQDVTETTERDRTIEALTKERRQIIDTANAPIFGIDVSGNVNEWNTRAAELFGYNKEDVVGKPFVDTFVVPSTRYSIQGVLANALKGKGTPNYELQVQTKSNEIRHLVVNATARRDAEKNVVGVIGVAQDVTNSKDLL